MASIRVPCLSLWLIACSSEANLQRLKAFTLRVDQCNGDAAQAQQFVRQCNMEELLEIIDCDSESLNWKETIRILEDYKPLDVQSGTMAIALCRQIRNRYPDWRNLVDGDGGDENLKDYPIEENPELTIRSVLNNLMLYQEGWGVHAIETFFDVQWRPK